MAYPTLTDNPGAIELAEAMRRGEMSPLDAVEAAIARASDVPADAITVVVIDGVVTVTGSVVCEECGGRRTPGGFGTVQQSLGAVVRAIPGVQSVEFDLQYERRAGPPPGPSGGAGG